jgi:hypothetical protein
MPINNPRYNFLDFGRAALLHERIGLNKKQNEIVGMELEQRQNQLQNRQKAMEVRNTFDGMPAQIEEMEKRGLWDEADKLRNSYVTTRLNEVQMIQAMRDGIDENNYKQVRSELLQTGAILPEMWPTEYSDEWFDKQLKDKQGNLTKLTRKWAEQGNIFSQDIIQQDGSIRWQGEPYQNPDDMPSGGGRGGKPWQVTSGDTGQLYKIAGSIYGGMWDPITEQYQGLNKTQSQEVMAIAEEASRIYAENEGRLPHAEAVARAQRKAGVNIKRLDQDPNNRDPAGLFTPR